ncbi:hypothetical protein SAG0147_08520 [Streptococcus agalactiae MRI Z1-048]|nr:glycerophosphoryl diester phosphodiesterase family protein [Streptococcus agalactiae CNCTC 10/84]EPT56707.1 hypothetical protein SAG0053_06990 [Streptococcus agalactiae CCUG 25532]EPT85570.1 hypothetical protein SAG0099_03040 [Streptococcus agalactiae BSU247]EPV20888.1 hypothetical protein SAG0334_04620 [Streptococcus agalactiae GB00640]EPX02531.1 hypothetical protein SAG0147_08520 [Streptococcus agalactiae MRI Z1-048]
MLNHDDDYIGYENAERYLEIINQIFENKFGSSRTSIHELMKKIIIFKIKISSKIV